jgi:hypothetical protein
MPSLVPLNYFDFHPCLLLRGRLKPLRTRHRMAKAPVPKDVQFALAPSLGLAGMIENTEAEATEPAHADAQMSGEYHRQ